MWLRRRVLLQLNGNIWPEDLEESRLNMANKIDKAIMREGGRAKKQRKRRRGEVNGLSEPMGNKSEKTAMI